MLMRMRSLALLLLVISTGISTSESLRILSLVPTPSTSHHIFNRVLNLELARRGHHVTVLSADAEKHPPKGGDYRHFVVEDSYALKAEFEVIFLDMLKFNIFQSGLMFFEWTNKVGENFLRSQALQDVISLSKNETFDLVIYEMIGQECLLGIVKELNYPPTIGISAFGFSPLLSFVSANPDHPGYMPPYLADFGNPMSIWQKLETHLFGVFNQVYYRWFHLNKQMEFGRQIFGDGMPPLAPILMNTSLILVNTNLAKDDARPLGPDVIQIGGMHVEKPKALPKELQQWMDDAKEGVIFFSLGSNLRSDKMPKERLEMMLQVFSKLKEKVLWKFETDMKMPANVKISKWLPQGDILGHPNLKLFITHGGGMSTNEALYNGVPLLVMPFFADQITNANKLSSRGMASVLHLITVTSEEFLQTIRTLIDEPSYKRRALELQAVYRDEPTGPLEKAVFWIEYVARHKGAKHLRLAARDLSWYELAMLDLLLFYLIVPLKTIFTLLFIIKIIRRFLFSSQTTTTTTTTKPKNKKIKKN